MNDLIKEQLNKCKIKLPDYSENDTTIIIPKAGSVITNEIKLLLNHCYIIQLKNYITNPPDNFTLSSNWNKGVVPKEEYMIAEPIKFLGKMVQFNCNGYIKEVNGHAEEVNRVSSIYKGLWLPSSGFIVLEELNKNS